MKKIVLTLLIVAGAISLTFIYSCKKKEEAATTNPSTTSGTYSVANNNTSNDDANFYKSENDQLNTDVNNDVSGNTTLMQRKGSGAETFQSWFPPCDATVDLSQIAQKIIIYHFNGALCNGRLTHRTGTVTVKLLNKAHWSDAGAVLQFSTSDLTFTKWDYTKSMTIVGTKTIKNVNGMTWADWYSFSQGTKDFAFQERALGVNVTFSGGAHANWNSAYTGSYHFTPIDSITYFTANGDTNLVHNYVGAWGTNRFGQAFTTYYDAPIVWSSYCNAWKPLSGKGTNIVDNSTLTLTFGTDSLGNSQNISGKNCPWGFNVYWHFGNGSNGSANIPYWY